MRLIRFAAAYPAIVLVPIMAVVLQFRVASGKRFEMFALGAFAIIGGTELALAVLAIMRRELHLGVAARVVTAAGALVAGLTLNSSSHPGLLALGLLIFGFGVALSIKARARDSRSA